MQATASADCDALAPDVFDADRAALANLLSALPKRTPRFIARLIPSLATWRDPGLPSEDHTSQRTSALLAADNFVPRRTMGAGVVGASRREARPTLGIRHATAGTSPCR